MTPEQLKARELIIKFQFQKPPLMFDRAKKFALICVDEIIKSSPTNPLKGGYIEIYSDMIDEAVEYWQEVKKEIENYEPKEM